MHLILVIVISYNLVIFVQIGPKLHNNLGFVVSKSELNLTKNDYVMRFLVTKDFSYQSSKAGQHRAKRVKYMYKFKSNQNLKKNVSIETSNVCTKFQVSSTSIS